MTAYYNNNATMLPVPHGVSDRVDTNLVTFIDPTQNGILPDGDMSPVMVKTTPINANILLASGNDLVILFSPENGSQVMGRVFTVSPAGVWTFVTNIESSIDISSFDQSKIVSSVLAVFSDTISTTSTVLSGRVSTVGMYRLDTALPTFDTLGRYVSDPKAARINASLAEGTVMLSNPNARRDPYDVDTQLGHPVSWFMAQTPIYHTEIRTTSDNSYSVDHVPLGLHGLSGQPLIITMDIIDCKVSAGNAGDHVWSGNFNCENQAGTMTTNIPFISIIGTRIIINIPANTAKFSMQWGCANSTVATGKIISLSVFTCDVLTADSTHLKYLSYIQGNVGDKNINISGWARYQFKPKPENMQMATYRRILAYNPESFEAFAVLLDSLDYFRLVCSRDQYSQMLQVIPYLTLSEVANLADNAAVASLSLLPLVRGVVSKLKSIGIKPGLLMKKGITGLHALADKGVDKLESMGLAACSTDMVRDAPIPQVEYDLEGVDYPTPLVYTPARAAVIPAGFDTSPFAHCSGTMSGPAREAQLTSLEDEYNALADDVGTTQLKPDLPVNPAAQRKLQLVVEGTDFPASIYTKCVKSHLGSNSWKVCTSSMMEMYDDKGDIIPQYSCSFFFAVVEGGRSLPAAVVLSTEALPNHEYTPFGYWCIDKKVDNTREIASAAGSTTAVALSALLCMPEFAKNLCVLSRAVQEQGRIHMYISFVMAGPDYTIYDLSFAGALYAAMWSPFPFMAYEAAAAIANLSYVNALNKTIDLGSVMTWTTPTLLKSKLMGSRIPVKETFYKHCFLTPNFMPVAVLLGFAGHGADVLTEIATAGVYSVGGIPCNRPTGLVCLSSTPHVMIRPPFNLTPFEKSTATYSQQDQRFNVSKVKLNIIDYIRSLHEAGLDHLAGPLYAIDKKAREANGYIGSDLAGPVMKIVELMDLYPVAENVQAYKTADTAVFGGVVYLPPGKDRSQPYDPKALASRLYQFSKQNWANINRDSSLLQAIRDYTGAGTGAQKQDKKKQQPSRFGEAGRGRVKQQPAPSRKINVTRSLNNAIDDMKDFLGNPTSNSTKVDNADDEVEEIEVDDIDAI